MEGFFVSSLAVVDTVQLFPESMPFQAENILGAVIRARILAIPQKNFLHQGEYRFLPGEVGFTTPIRLVTHPTIVTEVSFQTTDSLTKPMPVGRDLVLLSLASRPEGTPGIRPLRSRDGHQPGGLAFAALLSRSPSSA